MDDFIIGGYGSGRKWLESIMETLLTMGLKVNQQKTEIYYPYSKTDFSFTFLGYEVVYDHRSREFHLDVPDKKVVSEIKQSFQRRKSEPEYRYSCS